MICVECGSDRLEQTVRPEHIEDLGGVVVKLKNCVVVYRCEACGEEMVEIPDLQGLIRATAVARALIPVRLNGADIKFLRRALDMSQRLFAEAMQMTVETVSRWENDARGVGGMSEMLVRHNVCALMHDVDPAIEYDPLMITRMRFRELAEGQALPPIAFSRIQVRHDHRREEAWDNELLAA